MTAPLVLAQSGRPASLAPEAFKQQAVWIPYWSLQQGDQSTLHLKNALHHWDLSLTVDVLAPDGQPVASIPVLLRRVSNQDLSIASLLEANVPDAMRHGSIRIKYTYPHVAVLQAELSVRNEKESRAFTVVGRASLIGTKRQAYLAVHIPTPDTYLEVSFVNPTETSVTIHYSLREPSDWKSAGPALVLPPHGSQTIRISANALKGSISSNGTAIVKAEYSVTSSEIVSNAWLVDPTLGFSNTALLHDQYAETNTLFGTQLVARAFPENVVAYAPDFDGWLVFANLNEQPVNVSGALNCEIDGNVQRVPLDPIYLLPFSPQTVALASLVAPAGGLRSAICSGEFQYTGQPGHVIARFYASSESRSYGLYINFEPWVGPRYSEVYWSVEGDLVPIVSVANFSSAEDDVAVWISRDETLVELIRYRIPGKGSVTLNLRDELQRLRTGITFTGNYGGLYVASSTPKGRLLVKQHAFSAGRLTMVPYYGAQDYVNQHEIEAGKETLDLGEFEDLWQWTCYAYSGCFQLFPIQSEYPEIVSVDFFSEYSAQLLTGQSSGSNSVSIEDVCCTSQGGWFFAQVRAKGVASPSVSCNNPARGGTVTCTASGVIADRVTDWDFSGPEATEIDGPENTLTWSGTAVVDGTVTVTISGGGNPQTSFTVSARNNWALTAVQPVQRSAGYTCPSGTLSLVAEPTSSASEALGKYCVDIQYTFQPASVSGGPNDGLNYVTSITSSATFDWALNPHLDAQSGAFWSAQCGNWNGSTGFISGANLRANVIRHESSTSGQSHWYNYRVAQDNPQNNLGVLAEQKWSGGDFVAQLQQTLNQAIQTIIAATDVEPLGGVYNASGVLQGDINLSPYQPCN